MSEFKEYIVTLKNADDLEQFYQDMETPGGNLYIPHRAVELADRRPISRNTHYFLTSEEAQSLRDDPRVLDVELTPKELGLIIAPCYTQSSINWNKNSSNNNAHRNWGLLRATLPINPSNWGSDGTVSQSNFIEVTSDGKNVDVIVVDGHFDPTHPEYAKNIDGTGGTNIIQYNWFQLNPTVTGASSSTYVYSPYVDATYPDNNSDGISDRTSDNDHGAHVAGTIMGNTQGWARGANIYNISPYSTNPNYIDGTRLFDYIRAFHNSKSINSTTGRKNPTILNNSWQYRTSVAISSVQSVTYQGTTTPGPFTSSALQAFGIRISGTNCIINYRYTAVDADIADCISDGIIVVGSAGNDGAKIDVPGGVDYNNYLYDGTFNYYYHRGSTPAASGTSPSQVICVGSVSALKNESKSTFSNCGPRVDIYAPGENIISTVNSNTRNPTFDSRNSSKYLIKYNGTSMAGPQVTGALACALEIYPNLNQTSARTYLLNYAKLNQMFDSNGSYTDTTSLQSGPNRYLYYNKESVTAGNVFPKLNVNQRPSVGQVYPRNRIYSFGPQNTPSYSFTAFNTANLTASRTAAQLGGTRTTVSSNWTISSNSVTFVGTGLPYHSYGDVATVNTPGAQNFNKTWTYRGGQNTTGTQVATGAGLIGIWLNGVSMFNPSAQSGGPSGPNTYAPTWQYNASSESGDDLGYNFGEDGAGGHAAPPNQYHYHDFSFDDAWVTGSGNTGAAYGTTGLAEINVIPYLSGSLTHPDGHSKILGISADGYPVYGPFGYINPTNSTSGIRRMTSGYGEITVRTGANPPPTSTYPFGTFCQDYTFVGYESPVKKYTVSTVTNSYTITEAVSVGGFIQNNSLGNDPTITVQAGAILYFNVTAPGQPFYIKTSATTGTGSLVTSGVVTGQGATSGQVRWHTLNVSPGTYYYVSGNNINYTGQIIVESAVVSTLDRFNGRYCVTPDFPSGTYAYFCTLDSDGGPVYPYILGNNYYSTPATL